MTNRVDEVAAGFFAAQERLLSTFEQYDGRRRFDRRPWARDDLGHGTVGILEGGAVFERAAVNVSAVARPVVPEAITATRPHLAGQPFRATGISLVLHPLNPYAPSFHANFRYFESGGDWWFGGGLDLTPMYGFAEDGRHFHRTLAAWCARHPDAPYEQWKAECDRYFTIPHRREMRGLGGVFFDRLSTPAAPAVVADGIDTLEPAYLPLLDRRCHLPYGDHQRAWQLHRRGRYVEFNLGYDRGTRFGLQTSANIEAVLVSLPPHATWTYDHSPAPGSPEAATLALLQPRDWITA
ncbi:Coproporphyrinogen oxidase [Kribbella flavida DSM 17836]|uniref:coproporphyrinogen oxidase n=1 Tax=Kribbella flavida (strain DSM 17836 / JCM 10339 / NBRC 14399) TaxID=479435 RepID=D2PWU0_KRIFD|nr:oxygen-dependent coproporphyrinogen oxidase [Kribbella flavida]ADB35320.1 Coproporphyrinogen oxidase [Kribbella flavida DSM 17836]